MSTIKPTDVTPMPTADHVPPILSMPNTAPIDDVIDDTPVPPAPVPPAPTSKPIEPTPTDVPDDARRPHRARVVHSINAPIKQAMGDEIMLPPTLTKEAKEVLESLPNVSFFDSPQSRDWAMCVRDGLQLNTLNETLIPTLEDPEAEFRHDIEINGMNANARVPRHKALENTNLQGERAVIRLISHLGLGTLFSVPLWHSGIWVTFKPPSESGIVELNRILMNDKIQLGRYTYGMIFSNITSYTVNRVMDFALQHIYDISVKAEDISIDQLKDHIATQDIWCFLWGFMCTMYPRGFKYRRACITDPDKCTHILEDTLNLTKLQWTNTMALTDWQRTFMSSHQSKSKSLADVTRYREEMLKGQTHRVEIPTGPDETVAIVLHTPSVREYIDSGYQWIGGIADLVDRVLGADADDDDRNALIVDHGKASFMRQYGHWVSSIEFATNTVDDRETIDSLLDMLSADDEVRVRFTEAVVQYINTSTISVIGIPVYECPSCGSAQEIHDQGPYRNLIPLDVMSLFFGLLTQRLRRMNER
jgi:hypothetical protein